MHRPTDFIIDESQLQPVLLSNGIQANRTSEIQQDYAKLDESVFQQLLVGNEVQIQIDAIIQRIDNPIVRDAAQFQQLLVGNEVQIQIDAVIQRIDNPIVRDTAQSVLGQLLQLFDWLARIEVNLHSLDTLLETLLLLYRFHLETRDLVAY